MANYLQGLLLDNKPQQDKQTSTDEPTAETLEEQLTKIKQNAEANKELLSADIGDNFASPFQTDSNPWFAPQAETKSATTTSNSGSNTQPQSESNNNPKTPSLTEEFLKPGFDNFGKSQFADWSNDILRSGTTNSAASGYWYEDNDGFASHYYPDLEGKSAGELFKIFADQANDDSWRVINELPIYGPAREFLKIGSPWAFAFLTADLFSVGAGRGLTILVRGAKSIERIGYPIELIGKSANFDAFLLKNGLHGTTPDFKALSTPLKGQFGEIVGDHYITNELFKGAKLLGDALPRSGQGIDAIYKFTHNGVEKYIITEFKGFGGKLGSTLDKRQMSNFWLEGKKTDFDRVLKYVGGIEHKALAKTIIDGLDNGRSIKLMVKTNEASVKTAVLDANARVITNGHKIIKYFGGTIK